MGNVELLCKAECIELLALLQDEALADDDDFEEDDEKEEDDDDIEFMDEDSPKVNRKGKKPAKKAAVIDMSDEEDALEVVPPPKKRRAPESAKPAAKAAPARALPASVRTSIFHSAAHTISRLATGPGLRLCTTLHFLNVQVTFLIRRSQAGPADPACRPHVEVSFHA